MGIRGLFAGWHLVVLIVLVVVIFGWKRLPDAARSLGRSMRIFKSEVDEMKTDRHDGGTNSASGRVLDPQAFPDQAGAQAPQKSPGDPR